MRWILALVVLFLTGTGELAAQGKGIRLWNLTTATISNFQLSPVGKDSWGPNQALNDKDKEVDHDERLRITGIEPGRYDAKVLSRHRQCLTRYRDQGRRGILDPTRFEGLQQVILAAREGFSLRRTSLSALSLALVFAAPFDGGPFGCSPTHCAI